MEQTLTSSRTSEEVAAHFRDLIHSGDLAVGTRLPPQRELAKSLGVSRQAVFEGLAELETEGYVDTLRGATGGTFVRELREPAERWLERLRDGIQEFEDVLDFRIGVERQIATLAARRRTDRDLAAMQQAVDELAASTSLVAYRSADAAFHRALAGAARNDLLERAVFEARARLFFPVDQLDYEPTTGATAREHSAIVRAVRRADAASAARAVTTHLEHTRTKLHSILATPAPAPAATPAQASTPAPAPPTDSPTATTSVARPTGRHTKGTP
jgi:GntR family transcriptional regulator, transcriptional repressor for pyruvate dehydrogenase complex